MKRNEFRYQSCDKMTKIHGVEWAPDGEARAVLQICHGMVEYILRYDMFASWLANRGFYVVGHDHLGHGLSVQNEDSYGHFPEKRGNQFVIGDIHKLRCWAQKKHPDVPYFMLGHSMGSFLLRQYLTVHGEGLDGAVIMGTGQHSMAELCLGQFLCRLIAGVKGWNYRSKLVNHLGTGGFNRRFEPTDDEYEWVSASAANRSTYATDRLCGFIFTVSAYYQMFEGMKVLEKKESMKKVPQTLPVLFVSGEDDPVGDFGKSVRKVYQKYCDAGLEDVELKLYRDDRHEILNEDDRETIYEDIYLWMTDQM